MSAVAKPQVGVIAKCFADLVTYVALFKKTCAQKQQNHSDVHNQVKRLLSESAKRSTDYAIDPRDYDDARFAICAWLDETMMNTPWVHRGEWHKSLLQTELYGTTNAGEEFFDRLNRLGNGQNHIREVYFMCLCLGFMGRYCHPGDEIMLDQLRLSNIHALLGSQGTMDYYVREPMFSCAYDSLGKGKRRFQPMRKLSYLFGSNLFLILIPIMVIVGLFIIYTFVLDGVKDNLLIHLVGD